MFLYLDLLTHTHTHTHKNSIRIHVERSNIANSGTTECRWDEHSSGRGCHRIIENTHDADGDAEQAEDQEEE